MDYELERGGILRRGREAGLVKNISFGKSGPLVSVTIEHGVIKLLVCQGIKVLGYRVLPVNPRFFREGLVTNSVRVAGIIQSALQQMDVILPPHGRMGRVVGAAPGFQSNLRLLELPRTRGLDPKVVIPQEARRIMGISPETTQLVWHRLPDRLDRTRWLVATAARRAIASLLDTAQRAGLRLTEVDLRPFALACAVNQPDAIITWVASDGCDVVIVRDSVPVEYQFLFWGAEPVEGAVLVERLTGMAERAIASYDANSVDGPLSDDVTLFVCGSIIASQPEVASRVVDNLGREAGKLNTPLEHEEDFPIQDLIVNIGLALRSFR